MLVGPPAVGKGSQLKRLLPFLKKRGQVEVITTGDIARADERMRAYTERGELVPDELLLPEVLACIKKSPAQASVVIDGAPRTLDQARPIVSIVEGRFAKDEIKFLFFGASLPACIERSHHRRQQAIRENKPPRRDDSPSILVPRYSIYDREVGQMKTGCATLGRVISIDADQELDRVTAEMLEKLGLSVSTPEMSFAT